MKGLITVCARGGSKGIPGKNIKMMNGKPLIYYTLKVAYDFSKQFNVDIFLSTDSEEIKNVVRSLGFVNICTDYLRPEELSTDAAGKLDAIIDIKNFAETKQAHIYDYIIDLDVTSPFRTVDDLQKALDIIYKNKEANNLFSVSPAHRNPYFNMVEENGSGFYKLCKTGEFLTRQSAPKVYDLNASFYIFKKEFFTQNFKTVITDKSTIYQVPHLCFDLDNPIDFEFMSYLLENNKLDFQFIS